MVTIQRIGTMGSQSLRELFTSFHGCSSQTKCRWVHRLLAFVGLRYSRPAPRGEPLGRSRCVNRPGGSPEGCLAILLQATGAGPLLWCLDTGEALKD
jgi:hypothetical protein